MTRNPQDNSGSVGLLHTLDGGWCYWLTGLSGAGKTSVAEGVQDALQKYGVRCIVLDGDKLRAGLNLGLGFSREDRRENIRRTSHVSRLMIDAGVIVLVAAISPFSEDRKAARNLFAANTFFEVYVSTDLQTCAERDPKGLYALSRAGKISHLTGIDDPYEQPVNPDFIINNKIMSLNDSISILASHALERCSALIKNKAPLTSNFRDSK